MRNILIGMILFSLLGGLGFFVLQSQYVQWQHGLKESLALQQQVMMAKRAAALAKSATIPTERTLQQLPQLFASAHLSLTRMQATESDQYIFSLEGEFDNLRRFLLWLEKENYPVRVGDISITRKNTELTLGVLNPDVPRHVLKPMSFPSATLFCRTSDSLPITASHIAGFIQQAQTNLAIVALPDHTQVVVKVGSEIGKEHAVVRVIQKNDITLQLPNQKIIHIFS